MSEGTTEVTPNPHPLFFVAGASSPNPDNRDLYGTYLSSEKERMDLWLVGAHFSYSSFRFALIQLDWHTTEPYSRSSANSELV